MAKIKIDAYLNFDGTTEEAFNFYKSVFGGEFSALMRFKDMPPGEQQMPPEEGERIMHMSLPIGDGNFLMGSDISEGMGMKLIQGNNVYLSIHPDSLEESQRLFDGLSKGGKIEMEFQKMFWGDYFGSFTDKFGIPWMINCEDNKK